MDKPRTEAPLNSAPTDNEPVFNLVNIPSPAVVYVADSIEKLQKYRAVPTNEFAQQEGFAWTEGIVVKQAINDLVTKQSKQEFVELQRFEEANEHFISKGVIKRGQLNNYNELKAYLASIPKHQNFLARYEQGLKNITDCIQQLAQNPRKIVIVPMGKMGKGAILAPDSPPIEKGEIVAMYACEIVAKTNQLDPYHFAMLANPVLNNGQQLSGYSAKAFANIARYFQHAPTDKELATYYHILKPQKSPIATENIESEYTHVDGVPALIFRAKSKILSGQALVFSYGPYYFSEFDLIPLLCRRNGTLLDESHYRYRGINLILRIENNAIKRCVTWDDLLNFCKEKSPFELINPLNPQNKLQIDRDYYLFNNLPALINAAMGEDKSAVQFVMSDISQCLQQRVSTIESHQSNEKLFRELCGILWNAYSQTLNDPNGLREQKQAYLKRLYDPLQWATPDQMAVISEQLLQILRTPENQKFYTEKLGDVFGAICKSCGIYKRSVQAMAAAQPIAPPNLASETTKNAP